MRFGYFWFYWIPLENRCNFKAVVTFQKAAQGLRVPLDWTSVHKSHFAKVAQKYFTLLEIIVLACAEKSVIEGNSYVDVVHSGKYKNFDLVQYEVGCN